MIRFTSIVLLVLPLQAAAQLLNGSDFRVNVATLENQDNARVAANGNRFAVVWNRNSSGAVAYLRLFDRAAQPVTGEISLSGLGGSPAVAPSGSGFVVAYAELSNLFAARYDSSGSPLGAPFRVNQYTTGLRGNPAIASGPDGGFVIVWAGDGVGDGAGIHGARFDPNGTRLADDFVVNSYTTGGQIRPSVAFSGGAEAEFVVAWASSGIQARRFDAAGAPLTSDFRVDTSTTGSRSYPAVAANPGAPLFVVTWQNTESAQTDVFGRRIVKLGLLAGDEFPVNTTSPATFPAVVIDPGGTFVVTYSGIRGQRFNAGGTPSGGEFLVSTATTGTNLRPTIASFGLGNHVVCWTNSSRDGSAGGVFGQRFGPRGDANGDGVVNVTDVFHLINALFAAGPAPSGAADADGSGVVDVGDIFFLINFLFAAGPAPAA